MKMSLGGSAAIRAASYVSILLLLNKKRDYLSHRKATGTGMQNENIQEELQTAMPTLAEQVKELKPTIDSVVAQYDGTGDPALRAHARAIAAKAIQTYNPEHGASLKTWVTQQLRQLSRIRRQSQNTLSIPEGIQLDSYTLHLAEQKFMEANDREPTVQELADISKLPIKRITKIRDSLKPVASESSYNNDEANILQGSQSDFTKDATDYVYKDSDYIDRKIIEDLTGYGGADILTPQEVMKKYKLTPVQLSRRRARLAMRINKFTETLERINA